LLRQKKNTESVAENYRPEQSG